MFPLFDVDEGIWNVFSILQITQKWKINLLHIIFLKLLEWSPGIAKNIQLVSKHNL